MRLKCLYWDLIFPFYFFSLGIFFSFCNDDVLPWVFAVNYYYLLLLLFDTFFSVSSFFLVLVPLRPWNF